MGYQLASERPRDESIYCSVFCLATWTSVTWVREALCCRPPIPPPASGPDLTQPPRAGVVKEAVGCVGQTIFQHLPSVEKLRVSLMFLSIPFLTSQKSDLPTQWLNSQSPGPVCLQGVLWSGEGFG